MKKLQIEYQQLGTVSHSTRFFRIKPCTWKEMILCGVSPKQVGPLWWHEGNSTLPDPARYSYQEGERGRERSLNFGLPIPPPPSSLFRSLLRHFCHEYVLWSLLLRLAVSDRWSGGANALRSKTEGRPRSMWTPILFWLCFHSTISSSPKRRPPLTPNRSGI